MTFLLNFAKLSSAGYPNTFSTIKYEIWGEGCCIHYHSKGEIPKGETSESQMSLKHSLSKGLKQGSVIYIPFW